MAELVIGLAATPQQWRRALHAHVRDHVAGVRLVVLQDATEVPGSGIGVIVVDDTTEFLTPTQALALRDQGVRIVGIYDPRGREGRGKGALDVLGVDIELTVSASPHELLDKVARLAPHRAVMTDVAALPSSRGGRPPPPPPPAPPGYAQSQGYAPVRHQSNGGSGTIIAVTGGSDSPGRTECAVGIAQVLSQSAPTVLVDLDEHSPSVARRLGYALAPNVLDALSVAQTGAPLAPVVGRRGDFTGSVSFNVITGLANPNDWAQLREIGGLLSALRATWRWVVIDTGPSCDPDQVPPGGARNGATRMAVRSADDVVAVCNSTPLGVLRLLDWATAAAELRRGRPFTVALNRAPRDSFQREQLISQVQGNLPRGTLSEFVLVAEDSRVYRSLWDAAPAPPGPFVSSMEGLVGAVAPAARGSAGRKRKVRGGGQ